ncbi:MULTISPECIES: amidohydrolase family protein [unclassified Chelatococcus]|uniref:amidohydrolase family protein n=1 Tax=unclassified Chelatococcus TaxID=2638111 RepID=UPI001BCDB6F6|nr:MULTISPECIES: amidohydrolase family protein [unclassified Chelatococcus]MBS7701539.1 amidohydrolase [Chelatococcus sp. YT9]MBX3557374.1 amidohydrolase [Chelatococcus sp.]
MIIDAQIHCWVDTPEYPTPPEFAKRHRRGFTAEQALETMDQAGVDRAILVPIGLLFKTGPTRNGYAIEAARRYPDRFAVMGQFDFDDPDASRDLSNWRRDGMLGIRRYFLADTTPLVDGSLDWLWRELTEHDLPFMSAAPGKMGLYVPILERHPDMRLIIDHSGRQPWGLGEDKIWNDLDETLALARYPNVAIKVSSLPSFSSKPYPFPSLHEPLKRIYDGFGPERMLWGSDATRLLWGYDDNLRLFTEALDFLTPTDKEWILGKAAAKACRWPIG